MHVNQNFDEQYGYLERRFVIWACRQHLHDFRKAQQTNQFEKRNYLQLLRVEIFEEYTGD